MANNDGEDRDAKRAAENAAVTARRAAGDAAAAKQRAEGDAASQAARQRANEAFNTQSHHWRPSRLSPSEERADAEERGTDATNRA